MVQLLSSLETIWAFRAEARNVERLIEQSVQWSGQQVKSNLFYKCLLSTFSGENDDNLEQHIRIERYLQFSKRRIVVNKRFFTL